jgi:hypothetical protein
VWQNQKWSDGELIGSMGAGKKLGIRQAEEAQTDAQQIRTGAE